MLYDNALLAMAYLEAYGQTGRKLYECVTRSILQYVERELTDENGGFFCGQDADSDGVEGKYYVFRRRKLRRFWEMRWERNSAPGMEFFPVAILKEKVSPICWRMRDLKKSAGYLMT